MFELGLVLQSLQAGHEVHERLPQKKNKDNHFFDADCLEYRLRSKLAGFVTIFDVQDDQRN